MPQQYNYFSKANQMSAVLKADTHRLRQAHPKRLTVTRKELPNGQGVALDVQSKPMTGRARHALAHGQRRDRERT